MFGIKESTLESPLEFYNQLLFFGGIKLVQNSFYTENSFTKGYRFIKKENSEFTFVAWINNDDITDILDSDKFFKKVMRLNSFNTLALLSEKIDMLYDEEKKLIIVKVLDELNSFLLKIKKSENIQNGLFIQEELINLLQEIYFKYNSLQIRHKLFETIINPRDSVNTHFHCRGYKTSFYKRLFEITLILKLIDDVETSAEDFMNVLTTSNPHALISKIQFTQNNYLVSYYLRALEPFFENLNFTSIESSKCFYNKQNKLLSASDLSAALSRGKEKEISGKENIDELISSLEMEE